MKKIIASTIFFAMIVSSNALAQSCQQFTNKGISANSLKELVELPATRTQVEDFKKVIGDHVGDIASSWFSSKKKALNLVRKNNKLTMFVRESLAMTRADCFINPSKGLDKSAQDNFDEMLNAVIRKHNL